MDLWRVPIYGPWPGGSFTVWLSAVEDSVEAVEDELEPVLEFVGVVVAGLENVVDCQF